MVNSEPLRDVQVEMAKEFGNVAVLIPCWNEEKTIGKVVLDFAAALAGARIYVFDNNSTDATAALAHQAGAIVVSAPYQGKGNVVKQMFDQVEADVYVMVDGDDTYPAAAARTLIEECKKSGADMIVGARKPLAKELAFRRFHQFGNRLVAFLISRLFSIRVTDAMSGYRVFSKEFVKSVPLKSSGFEVETELTLQAATKDFMIREVAIVYGHRPEGSYSKLNTYTDGFLVLRVIFLIFKDYKPLVFFTSLSALLLLITLMAGLPPVLEYFRTGYVYRLPLAVLATGTGILAAMSLTIGLVLDTISKYHNENFQLLRRLLKK